MKLFMNLLGAIFSNLDYWNFHQKKLYNIEQKSKLLFTRLGKTSHPGNPCIAVAIKGEGLAI